MTRFKSIALALSLGLCHCAFIVVTPPSHLADADSPRVADSGQVIISAQGMGAGRVFGPTVGAASIRLAKGLGHRSEIAVIPVFGLVDQGSNNSSNPGPYFGGAALESKGEFPIPSTWFVASHQWGGGLLFSEAGQVVSVQGGLSAGTKVWYLRPFINSQLWMASPIATQPISNRNEEGVIEVKELTQTFGMRGSLGVELALGRHFSLIASAGGGRAFSQTDHLSFFQLGGNLRLSL